MAELISFHYTEKKTVFHELNALIKCLGVILINIHISFCSNLNLALTFAIIIYVVIAIRMPVKTILKEFKTFFVLFFFIFIASIYQGRDHYSWFYFIPLPSTDDFIKGFIMIARFFMMIIICVIFISTTRFSDMNEALYQLFVKIPGIPAGHIVTMIVLSITFVPLIMDQYIMTKEAGLSRMMNAKKNPISSSVRLWYSVLINLLNRTGEISHAMESRCYSGKYPVTAIKLKSSDWLFLSIQVIILCTNLII